MKSHNIDVEPSSPNLLLQILELRAVSEALAGLASWLLLKKCPRGDGRPVLVLPGLLAGDGSTLAIRTHLESLGYVVEGWGLGRNFGPRPGIEESMLEKLESMAAANGQKVSLVGQSLGGVYARLLAQDRPDLVRCVMTLGSPVAGHPRASNAWKIYEYFSGSRSDDHEKWAKVISAPTIPTSSICSRTDGVVDWSSTKCRPSKWAENIEVVSSHIGMGAHPAVLYAIADRLAQNPEKWEKFERSGWRKAMFPVAEADFFGYGELLQENKNDKLEELNSSK